MARGGTQLSLETEGATACRLLRHFTRLSPDQQKELLKPRAFNKWLHNALDIQKASTARVLAVIRHDTFRYITLDLCETDYGKKFFTWSLLERIVNSKLDHIWVREIKKFLDFGHTIFQHHINDIVSDDWVKILELKPEDWNSQLQVLFFPTSCDNSCGESNSNFPGAFITSLKDYPVLGSSGMPITGESIILSRRPGFLSSLSDIEYQDIWQRLYNIKPSIIPTWHSWYISERNISSKVISILNHITRWVQPDWVYPERASKELKEFSWANYFTHLLWKTHNKCSTLPQSAYHEQAEVFITKLWDQVKSDPQWCDPCYENLLPVSLPSETFISGGVEMNEYCQRFKLSHWYQVLVLVVVSFPSQLRGSMEPLNDLAKAGDSLSRYSSWGLNICHANFEHNQQLRLLPGLNTPPNHQYIISEGDLFGAIVHYRLLKQALLETHNPGLSSSTTTGIQSLDQYKAAVILLKEKAEILNKYGWQAYPDDWNEDLEAFTISQLQRYSKRADICPGFLTTTYPKLFKNPRGIISTKRKEISRDEDQLEKEDNHILKQAKRDRTL
ncbi:uncharacterized protein APUU_60063S [Aspergillus puulaauensis]|uniref:Uncharacterized protein n=1 Tax=Aspergillus puulaauensis TaxID=1220207 RepID=A0A7R7XSM1_9EURO|nr:uncharacterized protein APUU_60063S [Aspergillus puulaauensis]BCS27015.1 hypothetical protein APUU_60063S [Aspergillus puulaauensis]